MTSNIGSTLYVRVLEYEYTNTQNNPHMHMHIIILPYKHGRFTKFNKFLFFLPKVQISEINLILTVTNESI